MKAATSGAIVPVGASRVTGPTTMVRGGRPTGMLRALLHELLVGSRAHATGALQMPCKLGCSLVGACMELTVRSMRGRATCAPVSGQHCGHCGRPPCHQELWHMEA